MVVNFFAGETTVFTLQFGNFLSSESGCFVTSRVRGRGRIRCHGRGTAVTRIGRTLVVINCFCIRVCVGARVCVCPSVILISSKVSDRRLDLDIFQVLVCLLALLGIFMNIRRSRHATYHSSEERWGKFEFQLTDKRGFVVV